MLEIDVEKHEFYDSAQEMFFYTQPQRVKLEHSLISIAKWESHWEKPYFPSYGNPGITTPEEELYYVECMIIGKTQEFIPMALLQHHSSEIYAYIERPNTATTIHRIGDRPVKQHTITAELIYYWMIKFGIPFECAKWHFNRLLTLIDVCNVKESGKANKMSALESARYRQQLNEARRAAL